MAPRPYEIKDQKTLDDALERAKSIVLISPSWSIYAVRARSLFAATAVEIIGKRICEPEDFCIVLEDNPDNCNPFWTWIGMPNHPIPPVLPTVAAGAGSLIWIANGKVVHFEISAENIGILGIVNVTQTVFMEKTN